MGYPRYDVLPIGAQYDLHADATHLQLTGRRVLYHARARALMEGMLGEYMAHMVWRNAGALLSTCMVALYISCRSV